MKVVSAPTQERVLKLINEFYFTTNCIIDENNKVLNTKLNRILGEVKKEKSRFVYYSFPVTK